MKKKMYLFPLLALLVMALMACPLDEGSTGEGDETEQGTQPGEENPSVLPISVVIGANSSFILRGDGTLYVAGSNFYGQLGLGTTQTQSIFAKVSISDVKAVEEGTNYTLLLKNDGTIYTAGKNTSGQLGLGDTTNRSTFTQVVGISGVATIRAGSSTSFIIKTDGSLWGAGYNAAYQLGLGEEDNENKSTFTQIFASGVVDVAPGYNHTLVLKTDGTVWVVGKNTYGQLGLNLARTEVNAEFTQVTGISGTVRAIAAGLESSWILTDTGFWAAGWNTGQNLGMGLTGLDISVQRIVTFTQVPGITSTEVKALAVNDVHNLILKTDGTIWGAGASSNGQLGFGDSAEGKADKTTFTQVPGISGVTAIAVGSGSSIVLKDDGTIWGTGNNGISELGRDDYEKVYEFTQLTLPTAE
jgi:alpha-tubulin suppressor-like RCC1 family protein